MRSCDWPPGGSTPRSAPPRYDDEWLPELTCILKGDDARPITRLYHGTRFAVGILFTARRVASRLDRTTVAGQIEIVNTLSVPIAVSVPIQVFDDADRRYMSGMRGLSAGELIVFGQSAYKVTGVLNDKMYLVDKHRLRLGGRPQLKTKPPG